MIFKKEKTKLLYRFHPERFNERDVAEEHIGDILEKATPKSSKWWSSLPTTIWGYKDYLSHLREVHADFLSGVNRDRMDSVGTAKVCPAIVGLFTKAFLIKAPCDAFITLDDRGEFAYSSANDLLSVSIHPTDQFYGHGNELFEGKTALKLSLGLDIGITKGDYMFDNAFYHSKLPFTVAKGFVAGKYTPGQNLNLVIMVDTPKAGEKTEISITAGNVLAYLIPSEYDVELEFVEKNLRRMIRTNRWKTKLGY